MANEFIHSSVGTTMTQAEFEAVGLHVCNSQATGDLIYASSSTQLTRLAKGAANSVLVMGASIPAWSATLPAITLSGNMTVTGYAFDAGAGSAKINTTGAYEGLTIQTTNTGDTGVQLKLYHFTASPAINDNIGKLTWYGRNNNTEDVQYGFIRTKITSVTDGAESGGMEFWLMDSGTLNTVASITSSGVLSVDLSGSGSAAQVDLFDDYDDAIVLRQGIQENNRELLADMGVFERKGTGSGYMMKIQPMVRLLAGGIYQTRQMLDDMKVDLENKMQLVERKLALLEN